LIEGVRVPAKRATRKGFRMRHAYIRPDASVTDA
jgi:hypothetical protein